LIAFGTRARAEARRRAIPLQLENGERPIFHKSEWMEAGEDPTLSPTIFLVEQPPHCVAPAHFHRQNQFQLFIDGSGSIGRRPVAPLTVHYAGAYTGYGPLVAGPEGLKYFTIRPVHDAGMILVSEREKMVRGPKRHEQAGPIAIAGAEHLRGLGAPLRHDAVPLADDGLGVTVMHLPSGEPLVPERTATTGHLFAIVLSGQLDVDSVGLGQWESVFVSDDETLPGMVAAPGGAQIVLLYVPEKAVTYA